MYLGFYDGIFIWFTLWFLFWWGFVYILAPQGVDHLRRYGYAAIYFLAAAATVVYIFTDYFRELGDGFNELPFFWLLILCAADIVVYHALRRARSGQTEFVAHHPHVEFLAMSDRYLISKSAEIVFQQTLIVLLALILRDAGLGLSGIRLIFAIVFTLAHLPLLLIDGWEIGSFFITAAAVASVFFPALILGVHYGFVYSFMLHQAFYVASGIMFWLYPHTNRHTSNMAVK
ncbi:MAG: hypothetical protein HZA25_03030 [Candidatus Niyogibacteria bacterium]|nr:hypothetical protein [Candidatus Niyogibacteria bacterium]